MVRKITVETGLEVGEIVRIYGRAILGIVVRHEEFMGRPGFYAFGRSPDDQEFEKENGVDCYSRRHIEDLARDGAEVITRDELLRMYQDHPSTELDLLLQMTK